MISLFLGKGYRGKLREKMPALFAFLFPTDEYLLLNKELEELDALIDELGKLVEQVESLVEGGK